MKHKSVENFNLKLFVLVIFLGLLIDPIPNAPDDTSTEMKTREKFVSESSLSCQFRLRMGRKEE